jgi:hypothetical protein
MSYLLNNLKARSPWQWLVRSSKLGIGMSQQSPARCSFVSHFLVAIIYLSTPYFGENISFAFSWGDRSYVSIA